jgi:hypothetical protein
MLLSTAVCYMDKTKLPINNNTTSYEVQGGIALETRSII